MKRDKLRIGVITAALAMMIAGGVLTWQQDARNGKADQAKQGETAQLTEDESTGTTEQQTEETTGDADGTRAVQDQADDVENSLEQVPEMEAACEEEAVGNPEADGSEYTGRIRWEYRKTGRAGGKRNSGGSERRNRIRRNSGE